MKIALKIYYIDTNGKDRPGYTDQVAVEIEKNRINTEWMRFC